MSLRSSAVVVVRDEKGMIGAEMLNHGYVFEDTFRTIYRHSSQAGLIRMNTAGENNDDIDWIGSFDIYFPSEQVRKFIFGACRDLLLKDSRSDYERDVLVVIREIEVEIWATERPCTHE